jgi:hypothetical protein
VSTNGRGRQREIVLDPVEHGLHGELAGPGRHGSRVELGDVEQGLDQLGDRMAGSVDLSEQPLTLRRGRRLAGLGEEEAERVHRLAQVVARRGEEARLGLVGLGQLSGPLGDRRLQPLVGLAQPVGHPVKRARQRLQLVAGGHVDAPVPPALAEAGRPLLERLDRRGHAAGQPECGGHGNRHAHDEQDARARRRGVERPEHLGERLLDEDVPARRRDGGRRGQDRARGAGRRDAADADVAHGAPEGCADVRQAREIRLAQDQADVGVGDQAAAGVDHVGGAARAELDRGDDGPHQTVLMGLHSLGEAT